MLITKKSFAPAKLLLVAALSVLGMQMAGATPTAEEAAQLGNSLTPMGAIKAGNKEGTIPEWTGGVCTPPAGYKPIHGADGGGPYVDPFAADKPLFKITAENLAQYADKVDPGAKEMFRRYPKTWYINVYPTRRSACFPQWAYDNTIKNVMRPKLVGAPIWSLVGAHAQWPFPIPKTGAEVMWNMTIGFYATPTIASAYTDWLVDAAGQRTMIDANHQLAQSPYWDNSITTVAENELYYNTHSFQDHPPASNGVGMLLKQYTRPDLAGNPVWSYIPGQRRVRLAPEFAYDGVAPSAGGMMLFDEGGGWMGKMDKYDWKLVGRQEIYIPYNASLKINESEANMMPNHLDPAAQRWELHRVWVVKGELRPGERHVHKQKVFLLDEDSWALLSYLAYDHSGKIDKVFYNHEFQYYDRPQFGVLATTTYVFSKGGAYLFWNFSGGYGGYKPTISGTYKIKPLPASAFTSEGMAGSGVR